MSQVKLNYRDKGLKKILQEFSKASTLAIKVGVVGPKAEELSANGRYTNAEVAVVNEFGSADGHVPPHEFLKSTFRKRGPQTIVLLGWAIRNVAENQSSLPFEYERVGEKLASMVKETILDNTADGRKHNAPSTIREKKFDHPLLATGGLADAVSYQLMRKATGDLLDPGSMDGEYDAFTITGGGSAGGEGGGAE